MAENENDRDVIAEEEVEEEEVEEEETEEEPEGEPEGDDPYAGLSEADLKKRLAKAEKAIVKNKAKKPDQPITKQPKGDEIPEWGKQIIQSEEKRSFGYEHQLSPDQVDAVFRYNGGKKPDEKVLARPEVKAMIKALGAKDRVAANTPRGGTAVVYKGKTFQEIMSDPDASPADKQGAFEAAQKKHGVG